MSEYEVGTTVRLTATFRDLLNALATPTTISGYVFLPDGTEYTATTITSSSVGNYYFQYTVTQEGDHTYRFIGHTPDIGFHEVVSGFFQAISYDHTDIDFLIPVLRFYLGDYSTDRYTTETLRQALSLSIKTLMRRWSSKYKIDDAGTITRNPTYSFEFAAPPLVQIKDEPPIVIQAAILIKSGTLQDSSWQVASWRDDEIAVSNIQADKSRHRTLDRDFELLESYFKTRLFAGSRQALPGFKYPPNWREG